MQFISSPPTLADLALSGPVLPRITEAVQVAEACRRAALALHRVPSATLAGKDADGRPLRGQHQHAHYVPDCRGPDPTRITHILVYAPAGLSPSEVAALARIQDLPPHVLAAEMREPSRIEVALVALGQPAELRTSALCRAHHAFASRTPFVLPRHCKPGDEPEDQLRRELRLRGLPAPISIVETPGPACIDSGARNPLPWSAFRRHRASDRVTTHSVGFCVEFENPIIGPILLGYGCHYGLGQLVPIESEQPVANLE